MFLAGGLGKGSPHCIITLVGSDPAVRPLLLDQAQAQAMLDQRVHQLEQQQVSTLGKTTLPDKPSSLQRVSALSCTALCSCNSIGEAGLALCCLYEWRLVAQLPCQLAPLMLPMLHLALQHAGSAHLGQPCSTVLH